MEQQLFAVKNMWQQEAQTVEMAEEVEIFISKLIKIKIHLLILDIIKNLKLVMVKMEVEVDAMANMEKICI